MYGPPLAASELRESGSNLRKMYQAFFVQLIS
jgi:hypothetical protein